MRHTLCTSVHPMSRTSTRDRFSAASRLGDYRIDRELRTEDTGVVYLGTHMVLPRKAELKVMHADQGWLRAAAVSVLREACLLEALSHPGIPRVFECGVLPDRRPWSAIGHVDGTPLDGGVLAISDLVPLLRDVGEILEHAHARGVTHGRVAAEHVLRVEGGRFAVCLRGWADATTTDSTDRHPCQPADDVRGLGRIAVRALTGEADDGTSVVTRCPSAPVELTTLIDRMLAGDATSGEVRECAGWLAATVELMPTKTRWTPVHGVGADKLPAPTDAFQIRISRTPTR